MENAIGGLLKYYMGKRHNFWTWIAKRWYDGNEKSRYKPFLNKIVLKIRIFFQYQETSSFALATDNANIDADKLQMDTNHSIEITRS